MKPQIPTCAVPATGATQPATPDRAPALPRAPAIPHKWRWHYRALLRVRDKLREEYDEHAAQVRSALERGGADDLDRATEKSEHDLLLAEINLEEAELTEVEAALERIRRRTYGVCELSGQPISPARLRAIPWTRLSHRAAQQVINRLQR